MTAHTGSVPTQDAPHSDALAVFNSEGVYDAYVRRLDEHQREAQLIVSGIHCAGCVRSIEQGLLAAGATDAQVNIGNHRAAVRWDERRLQLGDVIGALQHLGYEGHPYDPATQEALHRKQVRSAMLRLGVAGFGAGNVMLYSVGLYAGHYFGIEEGFATLFQWLSLLIALPVAFYSGWPFLHGAWSGLRTRRFNMDSLIALGVLITLMYSLVALLSGSGAETYFDSVTMIVFFLLIGRALETLARSRAGSVTEVLMGLQVRWATRLEPGGERTVPIEAVQVRDRLLVRPGEALPVDGTVSEGESELDESALTGESRPRPVAPGDNVWGGTLNLAVPLVLEAAKVGTQTVLARICRLVEESQQNKPPIQRLADRIASHFVSVILLLATGTFVWWEWLAPALDYSGTEQGAWVVAIAVLIVACPCALGLATPVAALAGSALAARHGLLVKGGEVLERAAHVTDVVLDKTGTLTTGRMSVDAVLSLRGMPVDVWFPLAVALESRTLHPIAAALKQEWERRRNAVGLPPVVSDVSTMPGRGAVGRIGQHEVAVGNERLMRENGWSVPENTEAKPDASTVWVAVDGEVVGSVTLTDTLRPDAEHAVAELRRMGMRIHLLSGDRPSVVAAVAKTLGIDEAQGSLLPDQKLEAIRQLQAEGRVVAMVGDGINDAPALIQADLAIGIGTGSDLALESSQVLLMRPALVGAAEALAISRRTLRAIRQNLALSLGYNAVAVPLAMAGYVIPLFAALAMASSSLLVVTNALRLRLYRGTLSAPRSV